MLQTNAKLASFRLAQQLEACGMSQTNANLASVGHRPASWLLVECYNQILSYLVLVLHQQLEACGGLQTNAKLASVGLAQQLGGLWNVTHQC